MYKYLLFAIIFATSCVIFAQEDEVIEIVKTSDSETKKADIPFAVIDEVPIYPGCERSNNEELKECMSAEISKFVAKHFNMKKIEALNLPPKTYRSAVQFKIDKEGNVVNVRARAAHPNIEAEAIRVISSLPNMIPGRQRGENVGVLYALPIIFEIEPPKTNRNRKSKKTN